MNEGTCSGQCDDLDPQTNQPTFTCNCRDGYTGANCSQRTTVESSSNLKLIAVIVSIVSALLLLILVGTVVFVIVVRNRRGSNSLSRQETLSSGMEMGQVMNPCPSRGSSNRVA